LTSAVLIYVLTLMPMISD